MIDLHIHTKYSDGEYDEYEIIEKVKTARVKEFAICDHDTIEGSKKVYNILNRKNHNLIFHSGVELSCRAEKYKIPINCHLLVRDFDYDDEILLKLLKKGAKLRKQKIDRMVELVKLAYNIEISEKEIKEKLKTTNSFGKPHMYEILLTKGNFDRKEYYACMDKLNSDDLKLSAEEVISLMKNRKASITLAHPIEVKKEYNLTYREIDKFIKYLKEIGIDSLETKHSSQTNLDTLLFSLMAETYNLNESSGSDFHGERVKPDVYIGKLNLD